jgi:biopolymer transport protein ExbD
MNLRSHSILEKTALGSVLAGESYLHSTVEKGKKSIVADLLLTALIDAFSILVIFLLMSFSSTGEILYINKMELPTASKADVLERYPVIKIDQGQIYLEDKAVTPDGLVAALLDLRKAWSETHSGEEYPGILTVQADKHAKYLDLNSAILAASETGFSDIRFAVVMK